MVGRADRIAAATTLLLSLASPALAQRWQEESFDFGRLVEIVLQSQSQELFGVGEPLEAPASEANYVPREEAVAGERVILAGGLQAEYVTRAAASLADMFVFWPSPASYTHLVFCIEQGRSGTTPAGNGGLNAAVQRIDVATGEVETILHGMDRCDGIRATAWGTVLATEETDDGRAYEVLDPLGTTGHWIANRATGDIRAAIDTERPSRRIAQRRALPTMAWEGLAVLDDGVVIGGDELRPGTGTLDTDGGAIFKFIPETPWNGGAITSLEESPLVFGWTFAMSISCQPSSSSSFPQYGQGCEIGEGAWVRVDPLEARPDADANGATGYYRPEDLHRDTAYTGEGVRFCWTNTGNGGAANYGEVLCAVDETPRPQNPSAIEDPRTGLTYLGDDGDWATVVANRFLEGDERFNSVDNLHVQPGSGIWYVIEDDTFGEIFACLRDGADRDIKTDGCIAILSVVDPEAEPTGFEFDASGTTAYLSIQHGEQPSELLNFESNPVSGETDDIIKVTGFKLPN